MISWLGALPDSVLLKGHKINLKGSEGNANKDIAGAILGMLKFSIEARYDHLMVLSDIEREQYNFWRRQCPEQNVDGHLLICQVHSFVSLPAAVPVQQFTDVRPHGLITELEEGQPHRLLCENQNLRAICGQNVPEVLLRLPQDVVTSICAVQNQSQRFFLPDFNFNRLLATTKYPWFCSWGRLGISEAELPAPRFHLKVAAEHQRDVYGSYGDVDLSLLRSIADHMRRFASYLLEAGAAQVQVEANAGENPEQSLASSAYEDLRKMQRLVDELDPASVQSAIMLDPL